MFSFLKKKQITVAVETYEASRFVAGLRTVTGKRSYKADVRNLQKQFYQVRESLAARSDPSGTLVIFHNPDENGCFQYFVGDLVDKAGQPEDVTVVELAPGDYAEIHVKFKVPNDLALSVAKAKCYFMETWLPGSGYRLKGNIESMELYDCRSNIRLPSIELIFPLEKMERIE